MATARTASKKTNAASSHPVADKVKETLHESVDTLAKKAALTEESVREAAVSGSENFAAKKQELEGQWNQSAVKKYATENPIATAGIAFAAGLLVSTFFKKD